jgi:heat-inducible transcriptional repressor
MSNENKSPLAELDARSRDIFRQIVETYLTTGDPVGSRNLSKLLSVSLSPASIRNVMSDLEDLGLIYAPHTSAGRLPTEIGLRFFVDGFLEVGDLNKEERAAIKAQLNARQDGRQVEDVLTEASSMLSGLSRGAGVVLAAKKDPRLKHAEFVRLEPTKGLVILVAEDGNVENRVIDIPYDLPSSVLIEATNYLNTHIRGRTLSDMRDHLKKLGEEQRAELDRLTQNVIEAGFATPGGEKDARQLIVRGRANLLENLSAMEDLERIRLLFDDLETKKDLIQLLGLAENAEGVRIFIGSENKLFSLSGSSLVVAPYRDADQSIIGVLGVIGPTRLNYARVVPMVDYTAQLVSRLLGER